MNINADLINSVQVSLEKEGVLTSLRSQLRAHVLQVLKKSSGLESKSLHVDIPNSKFT